MNDYSPNLSEDDVRAIMDAMPSHPIERAEVVAILSEIAHTFGEDVLDTMSLLADAVSFVASAHVCGGETETLQ